MFKKVINVKKSLMYKKTGCFCCWLSIISIIICIIGIYQSENVAKWPKGLIYVSPNSSVFQHFGFYNWVEIPTQVERSFDGEYPLISVLLKYPPPPTFLNIKTAKEVNQWIYQVTHYPQLVYYKNHEAYTDFYDTQWLFYLIYLALIYLVFYLSYLLKGLKDRGQKSKIENE